MGHEYRLNYKPACRASCYFPPDWTDAMLARFTCRWHNSPSASRLSLLAGVCLVLLGGCLAKPGPREDETTMDFRHIARVYESIQSFNNRPPRDLEEIKKYLADYHTDGLV